MTRKIFFAIAAAGGVLAIAFSVFAVNPFVEITYPIPELGNCQNRQECKVYCDQPENMEACLDFAANNGLMTQQEVANTKAEAQKAHEMLGPEGGPGGCVTPQACKKYCDNISHLDECMQFAEENNLVPPEELAEMKKVSQAIKQGIAPPPCNSKTECDEICSSPEYMEQCMEFAIAAGIMPEDKIEESKKMLQAIKQGIKPPPCKGPEECDEYCSTPENMQTCMEFAIAAGMMPEDKIEESKKMLQALKQGIKPPPCKGQKECDEYCQSPEHMAECMEFSIAAGMMPEDKIEESKKMLQAIKQGIKPPPCNGPKECDEYCSTPENMQVCMEFAIAAGMMPEDKIEESKKMLQALKQGIKPPPCKGQKECDEYCQSPEHMAECMEFSIAAGMMPEDKIEESKKMLQALKQGIKPPPCRGDQECREYCGKPENMDGCMQFAVAMGNMSPEEAERNKKMMEIQQRGGPGGCKGNEECQKYCDDPANGEECRNFAIENGLMSPEDVERMQRMPQLGEQGGPGGCKNEQECKEFCDKPENLDACMNFSVQSGYMSQEQAGDVMQKMERMQRVEGMQPMAGPGGCKNNEECKNFCGNPDNAQTCKEFRPQGPQNGGREFAPPQGNEFAPPRGNEFAPPMGQPQGEGGQWQPGQPGQMPPQPMSPEQEQEMRQRMAPQGGEGGGWQPGMPTQGGMMQGPSQGIEGGAEGWQSMPGGGQAPSPGQFPAGQQPPVFQEGQTQMLQPAPYISEPGMGMGGPMPSGEQAPLAPSGGGSAGPAPMFSPMPMQQPAPAPSGSGGGGFAPQPAPMMGPAPSSGGGGEAPAPPPQGLLAPFKSFLGSVAEFLSSEK